MDGALDAVFTQSGSGFNNRVNAIVINTDNASLYVGGQFTQYRGVANNAQRLAKLDLTSGALDTSFTLASNGFNGSVYGLAINTNNNSIYVGGLISQYRGVANSTKGLAKLDLTSGNLDTNFTIANNGFIGTPRCLLIDPSTNTLLISGGFSYYRNSFVAPNIIFLDLLSGIPK